MNHNNLVLFPGWIDQDGVCAIPAFLGATFSVAEGMAGASDGEWKDYHEMFARSVRHLDFTLLNGHEGKILHVKPVFDDF